MSRTIASTIRLFRESGDWHDGLNYIDCPECGGLGKMMVGDHDDGSVWYKCLRARCQCSGVAGKAHVTSAPKPRVKVLPVPASDEEPSVAVTCLQQQFWKHKAVLMGHHWAARACVGMVRGRFILPLYGPTHLRRGTVLRSFTDSPKALTLRHASDGPLIGWYYPALDRKRTLVIVEDCLSAARISAEGGLTALALCGTSASKEALEEINSYWKGPIAICLDRDAFRKSVTLRRQLGRGEAYALLEDVKDMGTEAFNAWVECWT
jgi:hypothetical protein